MPVKRSADEVARPPLSRGSACHRCFTRKVRCSGTPTEDGIHACSSCLRTARFKNHDLSQVRCSFNNEGLCSEEGGAQLNGEPIPSASGPTRRKLGSRKSTGSRSTSSRSSSSARSDSPSDSSIQTLSPASSVESVPTMSKFELELPQPPALLQRYSSIPYQFPPPLPLPTMPATSLYQREYLPPLQIPGSTLRSNASSARCSRDGSPITPVDPTPPLFARRSRSGAPMQISLPINNHSNHSPAHSVSTTSSCAPSLDSAPLQTPASWGNSAAPSSSAHHQPIHYGAPTQLPLTQSALDLAPYSALSPSSLSKFATASVPSFDFYVPPPQLENVDIYAPTTIAATLGLDPYNPSFDPTTASFDYPVQISNYSQHYPNQHPLAPTTPYLNVDNFSLDDFSASCGANFHLPSPGLTFTSSTPSWMTKTPYFCT